MRPEDLVQPKPEKKDTGKADEDSKSTGTKSATTKTAAGPSKQPDAPKNKGPAKVIAFANQKGGVAKTTTALNLAVAFKESGHRVLAVDMDPQGNLTMSQGIDPDKVELSMFDVLVHRTPIRDIIVEREIDIAVASIDLAGAEIAMSTQIGRERSLQKALDEVKDDYDFICIDTPPSLGLLTVNALTAANKVIVPVQCEYLSMRGLVQLQNTLTMIRENLNPGVEIEGILPTMLDSRTVHAKEAVEILEENFGELVFKSRIRKAIKFAEAPVRGAQSSNMTQRERPRAHTATSPRRFSLMARSKRASMREGPLADLFRSTEESVPPDEVKVTAKANGRKPVEVAVEEPAVETPLPSRSPSPLPSPFPSRPGPRSGAAGRPPIRLRRSPSPRLRSRSITRACSA